jgi:hypothetical protein
MNVYFTPNATKKLEAKLNYLKGSGLRSLADSIAKELIEGNRTDRLSGVDSSGRPQTPVKPRKGRYKLGIGPPLAPFGAMSRVVSRFRAAVKGSPGSFEVVAGWQDVVSARGVPFLPFHEYGVRHRNAAAKAKAAPRGIFGRIKAGVRKATGGGSWFLPPRPIFGISPRTRKKIEAAVADFKKGSP